MRWAQYACVVTFIMVIAPDLASGYVGLLTLHIIFLPILLGTFLYKRFIRKRNADA